MTKIGGTEDKLEQEKEGSMVYINVYRCFERLTQAQKDCTLG